MRGHVMHRPLAKIYRSCSTKLLLLASNKYPPSRSAHLNQLSLRLSARQRLQLLLFSISSCLLVALLAVVVAAAAVAVAKDQ